MSQPSASRPSPDARIGGEEGFVLRPRVPLPCAAPEDRCTDFRLIEGTYCTEDAVTEAGYFLWEEDRMYTKRESELIQQHLSQYGELPGGAGDELDDLF